MTPHSTNLGTCLQMAGVIGIYDLVPSGGHILLVNEVVAYDVEMRSPTLLKLQAPEVMLYTLPDQPLQEPVEVILDEATVPRELVRVCQIHQNLAVRLHAAQSMIKTAHR